MAQLADWFTGPSLQQLDKLQLNHMKEFVKIKEYEGTEKPKLFLRANYPVDILYNGPNIRTWCMSFEAVLQILKRIARSSNYKNVEERMARIWAVRQGLALYHDKLSSWGELEMTYASQAISADSHGINTDEFGRTHTVDAFCRFVCARMPHTHAHVHDV